MRLYEYVDRRGIGVFEAWYDGLQKAQKAALDVKIKAVINAGEPGDQRHGELPPNMFRGPVRQGNKVYPNSYKSTVQGKVKLRPVACKGPIAVNEEWTILVPAIEVGGQLEPPGCF